MSLVRLAAACTLFMALALASHLPAGEHIDRAMTMWFQGAAPAPDAPAAALVFLGDAEVIIPGVAVVAAALFLLGDRRRGRAMLWLTAGLAGVSLVAAGLEHVIAYPGPPFALKRHLARPTDNPIGMLALAGHPMIPIFALAAAALILLVIRLGRHSRVWPWVIAAAITGLAAVMIEHLMTRSGVHPTIAQHVGTPWPPAHTLLSEGRVLVMMSRYARYGFPSGHTMRTTLVAGTALRRLPALAGAIVAGMMVSLVYLGDHWTSEVIAGFFLGWACVEIAREVRSGS